MYHIRKDKRSQQSAESIYQSLLAIMDYKPFEQIVIGIIGDRLQDSAQETDDTADQCR